MADLIAFLLTSIGLTVLVVWPQSGPSAWLRESILRWLLPKNIAGVLDCYTCFGFWAGAILAPIWWLFTRQYWCWFGCLMSSGLMWAIVRPNAESPQSSSSEESELE